MRSSTFPLPRSAKRYSATPRLVWCLILTAVGPLAAQGDRWERQVEQGLTRSTRLLGERGYSPAGWQIRGLLNTEESERFDVPIAATEEYVVVGTCDDDCTGLHLVVSNPTGYEIDAARGKGNAPIVRITPPALSGNYRVTVTMAACRVSPCRYGVAVYRRPGAGREGGRAGRRDRPPNSFH